MKQEQLYKKREISYLPFYNITGDFLLFHIVSHAVPSAQQGLTSEFGMGSGVTLAL